MAEAGAVTGPTYFQVDAFTTTPLAGNAAGVVLGAEGWPVSRMQAMAAEVRNSETVFVLPPRVREGLFHLRFFTPTTEVPSCGHATLAAHHAWSELHPDAPPLRTHTDGVGVRSVRVVPSPAGSRYEVEHRLLGRRRVGDALRPRVAAALGLDADALHTRLPLELVDTGHGKLMVPLATARDVAACRPDAAALVELARDAPNRGCFVFALDPPAPGIDVEARMFAPQIGIAEDPATGNGNGPLGFYLRAHGLLRPGADGVLALDVRQGHAMGRPSRVRVTVAPADDGDRVFVGGAAVTVFRAPLRL